MRKRRQNDDVPKRRSLRSLRDLSTFWVQASVGVCMGGGVIRRVRILGPKSPTLKSQFQPLATIMLGRETQKRIFFLGMSPKS